MLRLYFKKKRLLKSLGLLVVLYNTFYKSSFWYREYKKQFLGIVYTIIFSMPKRQQYLYLYTLSELNRGLNYSLGYVFRNQLRQLKFYKRTLRSIGSFIAYLKKFIFKKYIYCYTIYIKNFQYRQYIFLKKFYSALLPSISFLICSKSYYIKQKYKRRIKRTVLGKILLK